MSGAERRFSEASMCSSSASRLATSLDVGWTSVLLEHHRTEGLVDHRPKPTPDQSLFILTRGQLDLAARHGGRWCKTVYEVGSAGLTPGGMPAEFRLEARGPSRTIDLANLFLPPQFLNEAADHYRRAGQPFRDEPLHSMGFHDPVIAQAIASLLRAMAAGAPDLYAETVAQWLATHLLAKHTSWGAVASTDRSPGVITDKRLARVVEYMTIHFADPIDLDRLSREAGMSKFHFAHLFRERTGTSPHRYLVQLRLSAARRMLASTERTVAEIAASSGFDSPAHFGAAFRRRYQETPGAFRAKHRS
jgi:AraC family transcriptional regulator